MTAKEELQQLYRLRELIDSKLALRQDKYDLLLKVTPAYDGLPHGCNATDATAAAVAACADLSAEIERMMREYLTLQDMLAKKIACVEDKDCRLILELRYLHFKCFTAIAAIMSYAERTVYDKHKVALKLYSKIQ